MNSRGSESKIHKNSKYNVSQKTVGRLFPVRQEQLSYVIPRYQREYIWGKDEREQLFDDIVGDDIESSSNSNYFIGTIIYIPSRTSTNMKTNPVYEIIDGQQRLTTLSILLLAIYQKAKQPPHIINAKWVEEIEKRLVRHPIDSEICEERIKLQSQGNNYADYRALLKNKGLPITNVDKPDYAGNRRIYQAFLQFEAKIDEYLAIESHNLHNLYRKVRNATMVVIEVNNNSDAFMLFKALNFRGAKLSPIDLIKNSFMSEADRDLEDEFDAEDCYEIWNDILENLGDDYTVQERFLRQYYNAFRDRLNQSYREHPSGAFKIDIKERSADYPLGSRATRTSLITIYDKLIRADYIALLKDLKKAAACYSDLINLDKSQKMMTAYEKELVNFIHAKGTPGYTLLLYLDYNQEKLGLNDDKLAKITKYLVKFFVRRNMTDVPATRDLDQIFIDIIDEIKDKTGNEVVKIIHDFLLEKLNDQNYDAENGRFRTALNGDVYTEHSDMARFILCYIENPNPTLEGRNLWQKVQTGQSSPERYIWTIEHIFPEGDNIPVDWMIMISGLDDELRKKFGVGTDRNLVYTSTDKNLSEAYLEAYENLKKEINAGQSKRAINAVEIAKARLKSHAHKLGNLTMTGYNSNLGNMSFEKKRDRREKLAPHKLGDYIGYKNGLDLNKELALKDSWHIEDIDNRTEKLVNKAIELFKF